MEPNGSSGGSPTQTLRSSEAEDIQRGVTDGIAIIGFSFQFPQEATTPQGFWEMLVDGRCAATEFPKDRMNMNGFYHPNADRYDAVSALEAYDTQLGVERCRGTVPNSRGSSQLLVVIL